MLTLILLLVVSGGMVYLAQGNLMQVTLHVGTYVVNGVPLFYVIIGSMLAGLVLAYLVHLINVIVVAFSMRGKDSKIKQSKKEIAELTKRIHQLELENEKIKNISVIGEQEDPNAL